MPLGHARTPGPRTQAFAFVVRILRAVHKLSIGAAAERAGIPRSTFEKIEGGVSAVDLEQLLRIASAFDIPLSHIIEIAETAPEAGLDTVTRTELAAKTIELTGSKKELIHHERIDRILRRPPRNPKP